MTATDTAPITLTYPGDRTAFGPDSFIGSNSRFFRPVSAAYNAETDRTAIEYVPVPMHEMDGRFGQKRDDKFRIIEHLGSQW